MDIAGPLIGGKRYLLFYSSKLAFEPNVEMADKTIIIYTNPGNYGTEIFDRVGVNIHVNPHRGYKHPGVKGLFGLYNAVHYHAFAAMLASGMSANSICIANNTQVNIFYDDIADGRYHLVVDLCWPFCCASENGF